MKLLIAMMGLPRSGKSTICKDLSKKFGWPIVNRDAIRLAVHGQDYEPKAEPLIKTLDIYFIRSLFLAGHDYVLCDETNYSEAARAHLKDPSWQTVFYPVLTPPDVCKQRAIETKREYLLPVIDEMYSRYTELDENDFRLKEVTPEGKLVFATGVWRYNPSDDSWNVV